MAAVRATPSPSRAPLRRRNAVLIGAATTAVAALFIALGGVRPTNRPPELLFGTAAGAALIAAIFLWTMVRWNGDMMGPSRGRLIALSIGAPLGMLAWKVLCTTRFAGMMEPWDDRPGYRCFVLTMALAALPLLAAVYIRRHSDASHPHSHGAALGVAVGVAVGVLVDLWCPVGHLPHVLGGHFLPTLVLGAIGIGLGHRLLAVRSTTPF